VDTKQQSGPTKRRQYSEALTRQMVAETQAPGASVSIVARRHDVNSNQLCSDGGGSCCRKQWSKAAPKGVSHGRYLTFQMAEVAVPRRMFRDILSLIARAAGAARAGVIGRSGHMRRTMTAEVRLDDGSSGFRLRRARGPTFGFQSGRSQNRILLRRTSMRGTFMLKGPGIRGMSAK
jgi:Transposase